MSDGIYGSINLIVSVGINYNLGLGGEKKDTGGYYEEQVILESFKEIVEKVLEGMLRRKTIAFLIDTNLYLIFILTTILLPLPILPVYERNVSEYHLYQQRHSRISEAEKILDYKSA
ncbi:MAG TPA: hypothetical protein ENF20_07175 [Candidatus Marinimicrobia bacterium]|nr:hypothetical protein [Candidatus Neomarinimicrobiota bacterium]